MSIILDITSNLKNKRTQRISWTSNKQRVAMKPSREHNAEERSQLPIPVYTHTPTSSIKLCTKSNLLSQWSPTIHANQADEGINICPHAQHGGNNTDKNIHANIPQTTIRILRVVTASQPNVTYLSFCLTGHITYSISFRDKGPTATTPCAWHTTLAHPPCRGLELAVALAVHAGQGSVL